jgi:hypothetical protein
MVNDRLYWRLSVMLVLRSFCQLSRSYFASEKSWEFVIEALPFGCLWYAEPNAISNAIVYAKFFSRSHSAVIRVYDDAGNIIKPHEQSREFKQMLISA